MDLNKFESLVYGRRHEDAGRELAAILEQLFAVMGAAPPPEGDVDIPVLKSYTRFASAISALIADPDFHLSFGRYTQLALRHAQLQAIYRASAFGTADYLLDLIGKSTADATQSRRYETTDEVMKLFLSYSLDSTFDLNLEDAFRRWPQLGLPIYLSMLSGLCFVTPRAHARRERLLEYMPLFDDVDFSLEMISVVSRVWMHCSYAHHPGKHRIKAWLNRKLLQVALQKRLRPPQLSPVRERKDRPTMVVAAEIFDSFHSMYRCYAPWLVELRSRFRLVLAVRKDLADRRAKELFDQIVEYSGATPLMTLVGEVMEHRPDIVYFPSVGMLPQTIVLANVRMAPIQIASQGHPATTQSEAIDYFLVSEDVSGEPKCFSERLILTPKGSMRFVARPDQAPVAPVIEENPAVLRIALPSMICKLSASLLGICNRLSAGSGRPLEFHFFPNMSGIYFHEARLQLQQQVPNSVVHPPRPYNEYIRTLGACHMQLSPFPFGGMNSNIDSFRQGLPIVTLEGPEPHACMDSWMIRSVGLPESLIARSEEEYEAIARKLILDDAWRVQLSRALAGCDLKAAFYEDQSEPSRSGVADAVWWVYQNHEAIQATDRRIWRPEDRQPTQTPT